MQFILQYHQLQLRTSPPNLILKSLPTSFAWDVLTLSDQRASKLLRNRIETLVYSRALYEKQIAQTLVRTRMKLLLYHATHGKNNSKTKTFFISESNTP